MNGKTNDRVVLFADTLLETCAVGYGRGVVWIQDKVSNKVVYLYLSFEEIQNLEKFVKIIEKEEKARAATNGAACYPAGGGIDERKRGDGWDE